MGGGEPVLCNELACIMKFVVDNDLPCFINTNATLFSNIIAGMLKENRATVQTSPDSGSAEVFRNIKGVDLHMKVWENIREYCTINPEKFIVKYVVMPENWQIDEFISFAENCVNAGVRNVVIMPELTSFWQSQNYIAQIDKMLELHSIVSNKGISVNIPTENFFNDTQKNYLDFRCGEHNRQIQNLSSQLEQSRKQISGLHQELDSVLRSRSWRFTKLIRDVRLMLTNR